MLTTLFTTKGTMAQLYADNRRQTVTWLNLPVQVVSQINSTEKAGYSSLQIAIGSKSVKLNKPQAGHLKTLKLTHEPRWIREIPVTTPELQVGDPLPVDQIIAVGDTIKATGISKGKGFAGVVKRYHFAGGPRTHGQSDRLRAPGSIGRGTTPGRVVKGKKMAGRMGGDTVTIANLKVVALDLDNHKLAVTGLVPGAIGSLIKLTITKKHV